MFKKFISVILCIIAAITVTPTYMGNAAVYSVSAASTSDYPYFYVQLSANGQKAYQLIRQDIIDHKNKTDINFDLSEEDANKITELLFDHDPLTFNIKSSSWCSVNGKITYFEYEFNTSKKEYDKMLSACDEEADNIIEKVKDEKSTYKKLRIIHDELVKLIDYNDRTKYSNDLYGALAKKQAACEGYSKAFSYICAKIGIKSANVSGMTSEDSNYGHMWNKVYYNKKWYNIDVTWDDPVYEKSDLSDYEKSLIEHIFFMVSDEYIGSTHFEYEANTEDNLFKYPAANDNSITYYKVNKKYADSLESAKNIIKKGAASAKGDTYSINFQCSSEKVLDETLDFIKSDLQKYLKRIRKKGKSIDYSAKSYNYSKKDLTITIFIEKNKK